MTNMVLIDMEMPKRCEECPFAENMSRTNVSDFACAIEGRYIFYSSKSDLSKKHGVEKAFLWDCPLKPFTPPEPQITTNIYDTEEIHHNCTVQILRNSVTGDVSVGWWKEDDDEHT